MNLAEPVQVRNAFRVVAGSLLAVRIGLATSYIRIASLQLIAPVHDHFFPDLLRHPATLLAAFIGPIVTEAMVLSYPTRRDMKRAAVLETLGAAVLLVHQATYFFATWVIVFWAGVFMVWMAWSAAASTNRASAIGPFLAQLLIAFFFLGGAAGKWTGGYWSGAVFEDLYFTRNAYSFLPYLHIAFTDATVHVIAIWFSRVVILVETATALVVLLPARAASTVSLIVAAGLWLNAWDLYEVCLPLMGIAIAGRLLAASGDGRPVGSNQPPPRLRRSAEASAKAEDPTPRTTTRRHSSFEPSS